MSTPAEIDTSLIATHLHKHCKSTVSNLRLFESQFELGKRSIVGTEEFVQ